MAKSITKREPYITPSTRERRLRVWLRKLDGLRGRNSLPSLEEPVLLLLDLQNLFLGPSSPAFLPAWPGAHDPCAALLEDFRERGLPILWTRHVSDVGDAPINPLFGQPVRPGDSLSELNSEWTPREGERVLTKHHYSAWTIPELDSLIRPGTPVVIAGVTTHRCVLATAVDCAARGRIGIVAADACATTNEAMHESALAVLAGGFAYVASTSEILRAIGESAGVQGRKTGTGVKSASETVPEGQRQ